MDNTDCRRDFNWINQDCLNGDAELLDMANFLLQQSYENPEGPRPVMFVEIEETFGFPHLLYWPGGFGNSMIGPNESSMTLYISSAQARD